MPKESTGLAARLKKKAVVAKPEPTKPVLTKAEKEQRLITWIGTRIEHLKEFSKTVSKEEIKITKDSKFSDGMGRAGGDAVDAAVEAGYSTKDPGNTRSCKVFWVGANTWRRACQAKLDAKKIMKILCDSIKENLNDC